MRLRCLVCAPLGLASLAMAGFLSAGSLAGGTVGGIAGNGDYPEGRGVSLSPRGAMAPVPGAESPDSTGEPAISALAETPAAGTTPGTTVRQDSRSVPYGGYPASLGPMAGTVGPGDCVVISVKEEARRVRAILLNEKGQRVAAAEAFRQTVPAVPTTPGDAAGEWVAVLAIPATARSGPRRLEVLVFRDDGSVTDTVRNVTIEEKAFFEEEVPLNRANTALRTTMTPERERQIDKLNAILFSFDPASPRYYGPWIYPVGAVRRSSGFSDRRTYRYSNGTKDTTYHYGIDFAVPTGTPVFSAGDGLVVLAERRVTTGWTVVVEHLPGVFSLYYHLDALTASEGELVRAGSLLGRSGATGLATGPHLHWEFRVNGEAVSPDWFAGGAGGETGFSESTKK